MAPRALRRRYKIMVAQFRHSAYITGHALHVVAPTGRDSMTTIYLAKLTAEGMRRSHPPGQRNRRPRVGQLRARIRRAGRARWRLKGYGLLTADKGSSVRDSLARHGQQAPEFIRLTGSMFDITEQDDGEPHRIRPDDSGRRADPRGALAPRNGRTARPGQVDARPGLPAGRLVAPSRSSSCIACSYSTSAITRRSTTGPLRRSG